MTKSSRRKRNSNQSASKPDNSINAEELSKQPLHKPFSGWPCTRAVQGWPIMILGWAVMLIFTFHASTHMVAAGDTWVAMACGRHFVNHGVDTVEPFSANSHKAGPTPETMAAFATSLKQEAGYKKGFKYSLMRWWADNCANFENWPQWEQSFAKWIHPTGWINQNWLTHVIFYELVPKSSYEDGISFTSNALVYWKFAIYIITVICVYYTSRIIGTDRFLAVVFSCFALFIGRSFLDVRPAGFSNLLVAVFLLILTLTMYKNFLYIWLIVPLTVFWCNVHGGYIYVYIMMIPFIGLQLFTCLNKKWTAILYNIAAWPFLLIVFSKAGFTLATFLFTILVIVLDFLLIFFKNRIVSLDFKGVYHSIGAFFAAFFASILFNPFHLTNLTHTFVISVSKNAERWRDIHEWHPAFDWKNPVGTAIPFLIMYIIIWVVFLAWSLSLIYISVSNDQYPRRKKKDAARRARALSRQGSFQGSKINFVMIIIAALTVYMAIRSRRFIPIAAIVACPLIAFFLQELVRNLISAVSIRKYGTVSSFLDEYTFNILIICVAAGLIIIGLWQLLLGKWLFFPIPGDREGKLQPRIVLFVLGVLLAYAVLFVSVLFWPISRDGQKSQARDVKLKFIFSNLTLVSQLIIFAFVIGFGIWFTIKFNRVYLEPWPNDAKYNSVFMRMTASDAKPFYAMKFIKDNKLHGKMLNYWTEGGFIAWGQDPDPNNGFTPLQLFMDGRAQAAYNRITFDEWSSILAGGQVGHDIYQRALALLEDKNNPVILDKEDCDLIGDHVDKLLTERDVWCVLMPATIFNDPDRASSYYTFKSLEDHPSWRLVFVNDRQKLLVNIKTDQGSKLYDGILTGATKYPDEYHKNLNRAHKLLNLHYGQDPNDKIRGLAYAQKAFEENPAPAAMMEIIAEAAKYTFIRPATEKFCEEYVESFNKNMESWKNEDGYRLEVESARLANYYLAQLAGSRDNTELKDTYDAQRDFCIRELRRIGIEKRW